MFAARNSFLVGGVLSPYWLAYLGDASVDVGEIAGQVAIDSLGNIYFAGFDSPSGDNNGLIGKYDNLGFLQWQRNLGSSANTEDLRGIAIDSSGNLYVSGITASQGAGGSDALIAKYDNSGTIQWQRTLGGASTDSANKIVVDSSGNVYFSGFTFSQGAGSADFLIAKYDTSGTIQWQRVLGDSGVQDFRGMTIDSSGNVYVTGYTNSGGVANQDAVLAKYDTSGSLQWQRVLGGANSEFGQGIAVDSSGNVYITGLVSSQGSGSFDVLTAKYDNSGTIQWQRILGGAGDDRGEGIAIDSSGNVYIIGYTPSQGAGGNDVLIAKYNTSGTLQWQRVLGGAGNDAGFGIAVDSLGSIYICGQVTIAGDNLSVLIGKLPDDGSLTGTYGGITYAVSTLTSATSTLTSMTPSFTAATSTLTSSTSTLTSATTAYTSTRVSV